MSLLTESERRFLSAVSELAYCNPFLKKRTQYERAALGSDFVAGEAIWSASVKDPDAPSPNVTRLQELLEPTMEKIRDRLRPGVSPTSDEVTVYEEAAHQLIYQTFYRDFVTAKNNWRFYDRFAARWNHFLPEGRYFETATEAPHFFACFRQVQRAFHNIFDNIIGNSMPAAQLRAAAWQSVFTHDLRRYRRTLYARMQDFPTLITGPSGTGKELIAQAIAGARYIAFDPARYSFADPPSQTFIPINLAALSPTLIESELFGHRRGAFTGAAGDRKGWLDSCPAAGSVFLDELGEMDLSIQVKLLRVVETRVFSAVGDTAPRQFSGKLIAATNRDLQAEIRSGRFREDLYYRLCADLIETPSLREQLDDSPSMLRDVLLFMLRRAVGGEADRSLPEVEEWVTNHLPANYAWPGNYREVEQCVRNLMIRGSYQPMREQADRDDSFLRRFQAGELTADGVISYYSAMVYRETGTYEETAKRLGLDRRTVKAKVERFLDATTGSR